MTCVGDAAATCHAGFVGVLGTLETSKAIVVSTGCGSGDDAVSAIDGCPSGVICGPTAGYAVFEVTCGGLSGSSCEGDCAATDVEVCVPLIDVDTDGCCVGYYSFVLYVIYGASVKHVVSAGLVLEGVTIWFRLCLCIVYLFLLGVL